MGMHSIDELIRLYTLEKITVEQTLGQVLQHLVEMNTNLQELNAAQQRMEELEREIQRIKAFVGMKEEPAPKKKDKRRDEAQ